MKHIFVASAVLVAYAAMPQPAQSKTWIVDWQGHGDFRNIQAAIDAAVDGDVVLVKDGTYDGFSLGKLVVIRSSGVSAFKLRSRVSIVGVPALPGAAAISGVRFEDEAAGTPHLSLLDNAGDVLLEDIDLGYIGDDVTDVVVEIRRCSSVAFTKLRHGTSNSHEPEEPTMVIEDSSVRLSDAQLFGTDAHFDSIDLMFYNYKATAGTPAIDATRSLVVLAQPSIVGGDGSDFVQSDSGILPGGPGAVAIRLLDSELFLIGDGSHTVTGGQGGDGEPASILFCPFGPAGDGGDGISMSGSSVIEGDVVVAGGAGGVKPGCSDGDDGVPYVGGSPSIKRSIPSMTVETLVIGSDSPVSIRGRTPGWLVLLISDQGGFDEQPKIVGPPLSVLPSGICYLVPLGNSDSAGDLDVVLSVPNDLALVGIAVQLQVAELAYDPGRTVYLGNAAGRVVGD